MRAQTSSSGYPSNVAATWGLKRRASFTSSAEEQFCNADQTLRTSSVNWSTEVGSEMTRRHLGKVGVCCASRQQSKHVTAARSDLVPLSIQGHSARHWPNRPG